MDTIHIDSKNVQMVAHRGVSGLETENTASAFVAAGNRSYYGIETDVHRTADGRFVVFHDDNTQRVAGDAMVVEETTYETLRSLRLKDTDGQRGRNDLRIPSLREYVRICKKYGKVGVLELKNRFEAKDIWRIVSLLEEEEYLPHMIIISFSLENLIDLRAILPDQSAQFLTSKYTDDLIETLKKYHLDLDIHYKALTPERVRELKAAGIVVNCWTVDDPDAARDLIDWGVDQITSNILE